MASLLPAASLQFCDENGHPYAGGTVDCFVTGTGLRKDTFQDAAGLILNTNPILLDGAGRAVILGSGSYRMVLRDSNGVLVWDQNTAATLADGVISPVMLPIVGASTTQEARDLMGVTQAIQDAITGLALLAGPTGPTGPTGPVGATGGTGPPGSNATNVLVTGNPGYWEDTTTGFVINFGFGTSDSGGHGTVTYAKPLSALQGLSVGANLPSWWANAVSQNGASLTVATSSPLAGGSWLSGPIGFWWVAFGIGIS